MNVLRAVSHCVSRQQGYSCSSLVCTAVASSLVCSINESIITSTTMLPFHKVLRAVSVTVCLGSKGCSAGQPPLLVGQPPLLVGQRQADGCFAHPGPTVAGGAAVAPALWRAPGHLRTRQLQPCRRPKPARAVLRPQVCRVPPPTSVAASLFRYALTLRCCVAQVAGLRSATTGCASARPGCPRTLRGSRPVSPTGSRRAFLAASKFSDLGPRPPASASTVS